MAGSSNFQQFNPNATNQLTDAEYTSDATRSSGAANPSVFPSETANKLFYQLSTFIYAMAQMLANKGYVLSDANAATLSAVLANMMTAADMAPYAPKASPALTGAPTTPTPAQSSADGTIPNTFWVQSIFAPSAWVSANYAPLTSPPLTGTPTAPTPPGSDSSNRLATTAFVKGLDYAAHSEFAASLGGSGYQKLPGGLILQWGNGIGGSGDFDGNGHKISSWTFPVTFPNAVCSCVFTPGNGGAQLAGTVSVITGPSSLSAQPFSVSLNGTTSIGGPVALFGIAIGF